MLQNLVETDVNICVNSTDSDRAVQTRHPAGRCNCKLPRLALSNCWRCGFLRLELDGARPQTANGCEQCPHEEKEFYSHQPILCSFDSDIREKSKVCPIRL